MADPDTTLAPSPWTYERSMGEVRDDAGNRIANVIVHRSDANQCGALFAASYLLPECVQALRDDIAECHEGQPEGFRCDCRACCRNRALLAQIEQAMP